MLTKTLPGNVSLSHVSELMEAHPERKWKSDNIRDFFKNGFLKLYLKRGIKDVLLYKSEEIH